MGVVSSLKGAVPSGISSLDDRAPGLYGAVRFTYVRFISGPFYHVYHIFFFFLLFECEKALIQDFPPLPPPTQVPHLIITLEKVCGGAFMWACVKA